MKPTMNLAQHAGLLLMIPLLPSVGCATSSKPQPTIVGPHCNIMWDKINNPKVTGYQITVIAQNNQEKKIVKFIPVNTTKISCTDAGADHEGLWDVTVQSCYDKSTCGAPTDVARMHIMAK